MSAYYQILPLLLLSFQLGCASATRNATGAAPRSTPASENAPRVYHLHLPGIAGANLVYQWWCHEVDSGVPGMSGEVYDWTGHLLAIDALQAVDRNHREAVKIAQKILTHHRADPSARIVLTAESGGTGLLVWALEDLPDDVKIDSVILLSPAISPEYDLTRALHHVRGSMHVFTRSRDNFILGWGTETYGTIDGKREQSAGRFGFVAPVRADKLEYRKLVQVPYQSSWWKYLNFGGHAEGMSPSFEKNVIAPLLADGTLRG